MAAEALVVARPAQGLRGTCMANHLRPARDRRRPAYKLHRVNAESRGLSVLRSPSARSVAARPHSTFFVARCNGTVLLGSQERWRRRWVMSWDTRLSRRDASTLQLARCARAFATGRGALPCCACGRCTGGNPLGGCGLQLLLAGAGQGNCGGVLPHSRGQPFVPSSIERRSDAQPLRDGVVAAGFHGPPPGFRLVGGDSGLPSPAPGGIDCGLDSCPGHARSPAHVPERLRSCLGACSADVARRRFSGHPLGAQPRGKLLPPPVKICFAGVEQLARPAACPDRQVGMGVRRVGMMDEHIVIAAPERRACELSSCRGERRPIGARWHRQH